MEITIKDTTVKLKQTFRSLMIYENIMNKSFSPSTFSEIVVYFYSVILASKKDIELHYDDFIDWLDENPESINDFSKWLVDANKQNETLKKN